MEWRVAPEGVQVSSVPGQQFRTEDWSAQASAQDRSAAPLPRLLTGREQPRSGLQLFFPQTLNRIEIRLTENKLSKHMYI